MIENPKRLFLVFLLVVCTAILLATDHRGFSLTVYCAALVLAFTFGHMSKEDYR
jgi:hypothetical protein